MARPISRPSCRHQLVEIDDELPHDTVIIKTIRSASYRSIERMRVEILLLFIWKGNDFLALFDRGWLRHFGWTSGNELQDADEMPSDGNKASSSVAERLSVVLQVARKVQNQLGAVCDAAEKIKKQVSL